jgi:hypothetical protein
MTAVNHSFAKLAAVACLGLASIGAHALELRGFRGVAWGDGADKLGAATVDQANGDVVCYKRERENMLFGERAVNEVRYCFHQDQLFMVTLDAAAGMKAMISELQRTYGRPQTRLGNRASWGTASSMARADLVALPAGGSQSRLTIHSTQFEPASAKSAAAELPRRIASAM